VSHTFNARMSSSAIMLISGSNRGQVLLPAHDRWLTGQILFVHVCAPSN